MGDERSCRYRDRQDQADAEWQAVIDCVEAAGGDWRGGVADADAELAEAVGTASDAFRCDFGDG